MINQTYIFEGIEVVKTGRDAIREVKNTSGKVLKSLTLVEIKPLNNDISWVKWVDPSLLFVVRSKNEDR
jgi:hypothetical protein